MNADPRGYYAALHVTPDATQADIRRAFRSLIRLRHPDVGRSDSGQSSGDDVHAILAAFAVLRDPLARAAYDREGRDADLARGTRDPAGAQRLIPVRYHRGRGPVFRATPVRWERGPDLGQG